MNKKNLFKPIVIMIALSALITLFTGCKSGSDKKMELTDLKGGSSQGVKLYIIDSGYVTVQDMSIFGGVGKNLNLPITSYLIVHPKGVLLWDAGIQDEIAEMEEGMSIFGGAVVWHLEKTLQAQLDEIGISVSEIDYVGISHLHGDHIGNLDLFKDTAMIIDTNEFDSIEASMEYARQTGLETVNLEMLKEHREVIKTSGIYDIFGDRSVVMIPTPGHSAGHTSLFVDLEKNGPVVLTGDLHMTEEAHKTYTISPLTQDKRAQVKSFAILDDLLEQTGAAAWYNHDGRQSKELKKAPLYYE